MSDAPHGAAVVVNLGGLVSTGEVWSGQDGPGTSHARLVATLRFWQHRLVFGLTGLALLGAALCCGLFLITGGNPWPDDALSNVARAQYFAQIDAYLAYNTSLDRTAWLLNVTGATTWLPLCGLFCLRNYIRHGWNRAIPFVLAAALVTSGAVAAYAWRACGVMAGHSGGCW